MLEFKLIYGIDGYNAAKSLRDEVFIDEQGFKYDYDEYDSRSWHIVGYEKDTLIGTARMFEHGDRVYKIGRVAVKKDYRGGYIGDLMMKTLQDKIVGLGEKFTRSWFAWANTLFGELLWKTFNEKPYLLEY